MKTKSGFEFDIKPEVLDNMELVDAIAELDEDPVGFSKVLKLILGDDRKRLYDHIKKTRGVDRVPVEAVGEEIEEIFKSLEAKNS